MKWELAKGKREGGRWRRERREETEGKHYLLTCSGNETWQKADRMTDSERAKEDSGWERNEDDKG